MHFETLPEFPSPACNTFEDFGEVGLSGLTERLWLSHSPRDCKCQICKTKLTMSKFDVHEQCRIDNNLFFTRFKLVLLLQNILNEVPVLVGRVLKASGTSAKEGSSEGFTDFLTCSSINSMCFRGVISPNDRSSSFCRGVPAVVKRLVAWTRAPAFTAAKTRLAQ